jgi:hypothetical protein
MFYGMVIDTREMEMTNLTAAQKTVAMCGKNSHTASRARRFSKPSRPLALTFKRFFDGPAPVEIDWEIVGALRWKPSVFPTGR